MTKFDTTLKAWEEDRAKQIDNIYKTFKPLIQKNKNLTIKNAHEYGPTVFSVATIIEHDMLMEKKIIDEQRKNKSWEDTGARTRTRIFNRKRSRTVL